VSELAIGIDLGTTLSSVAVFDPATNKPEIVPNADGDRLTPSAVYLAEDGRIMVGTIAVAQSRRTPSNVKRWIKRAMGTDKRIRLGDSVFRPEELSAAVLAKLIQDAEEYFGVNIKQAVITVPAYFDDPRRKATADAGRISGLESVHLLNEPTAAGLSFGLQEQRGSTFLVYDLGGGTFDVSIMKSGGEEIEVLSIAGDHWLGGYDFDLALAKHLARKFKLEHGFYPARDHPDYAADWHELLQEAEEAKKKLSRLPEVQATIRFGGKRSDVAVNRQEFEELLAPYVARTESLLKQAIQSAGLAPEGISEILLVGGSTRIPAFRESVRRVLPHLDPLSGINPDEIVAAGASIQAQLLLGQKAGEIKRVREVTAHPFGVLVRDTETGKVVNDVMIPRNAPIPQEVRKTFYTIEDGQTLVEARITQGEAGPGDQVGIVAATELAMPQGRPANRPIDVAYSYDEEGRMQCEFLDRETGKVARLDYKAGTKGLMSEEEVGKSAEEFQELQIT